MKLAGTAAMTRLLRALIPASARIIEIGATGPAIGRFLVTHGWPRYIGLTTPEFPEHDLGDESTAVFQPCPAIPSGPDLVRKNNADVLVLAGAAGRNLWRHSWYAQADVVIWAPGLVRASVVALAGIAKALVRRRVAVAAAGLLPCGAAAPRLVVVLQNRRRRARGRRLFLSPQLRLVFERLREERVTYMVLRWFEDLPAHQPGRDIDVLVADDEVERFSAIAEELPGFVECEVYSVSGAPGTDYRETAHFPPEAAERMLSRAVWWNGCYRVPCPEDYFHGLAYHAVYHKGHASGIPSALAAPPATRASSHDYAAVLQRMADALSIDAEITLEGLDRYLASRGLRPGLDVLGRFTRTNAWVRAQVDATLAAEQRKAAGFCTFYVRRRAVELGLDGVVPELIRSAGFDVLATLALSDAESGILAGRVRGGNWSRGPWPAGGGGPAAVIVAFDPAPMPPDARTLERHPLLDNLRVRATKKRIREELEAQLPEPERCNLLHSSDNAVEALHCLELILPREEVNALLAGAAGAAR